MKHLILLSILLFTALTVSAKDVPCQVDLYQSQSQFKKAIQKPGDKNLRQIISQKDTTLPEVMAKADRFQIVKPKPQENLIASETEEESEEVEGQTIESNSVFGGMFDLLVPTKLRNQVL